MNALKIHILFEDEALLAVNKPAGIPSIPDRFPTKRTAVSRQLESRYGKLWIVHRLDLDTSGVLLFARNESSHQAINEQFSTRKIDKSYHALVSGSPPWMHKHIDLPLLNDADFLHRTRVHPKGKSSVTDLSLLESYKRYALVKAKPLTGRTHQVRVHLAHSGFPVCVDQLYGDAQPIKLSDLKRYYRGDRQSERPLISRLALHAHSLTLIHPVLGTEVNIHAPYSKDFKAVVYQLRKLFGETHAQGEPV